MKKIKKEDILIVFIILYATVSLCMNMFSVKPLSFGFDFVIMDGGLLISWIPYFLSSVITECYGEKIAKKTVIITGFTIFILSIIAYLESCIPTLPEYIEQANHFKYVFNNGPRIIISSIIAFLLGGIINIKITAIKERRKNFAFFIKIFLAGLVGQIIDNTTFEVLAFAPLGISLFEMRWEDIFSAIMWSTIIEMIFESIFIMPLAKPLIMYINNEK